MSGGDIVDWYAPIARRVMIPLHSLRNGSRWPWEVKEIAAWETLSSAEIAKRQWRKLKALLEHAYQNVPYYRRAFDERGLRPTDIDSPQSLARLPLLTKEHIRHHQSELLARNIPAEQLTEAYTGGTTGLPMLFKRDGRCRDLHYAAMAAFARWYGFRPGDQQALVWAAPQDLLERHTLRQRAADWLRRRPAVLDARHITEVAMHRFAALLRRMRPRMLRGYTDALDHLARFLESRGMRLTVPAIVCTAEPLWDDQRERIERTMGGEVFNEYGSREFGLVATECSQHKGLHVNAFSLHLEVLLPDGRPAPAGTLGRIVGTDLDGYGMPFIRYDLGDLSSWAAEPCPCNRKLPLLRGLEGRVCGLLVGADGAAVSGHALTRAMAMLDVPGQLQFLQEQDLSVTVRVVPERTFGSAHRDAIAELLRSLLGQELVIAIETVSDIPRTRSGKYVYSLSRAAFSTHSPCAVPAPPS